MAQSISQHLMQCFLLPKKILSKLDASMRDFFWGFDQDSGRYLYLRAWDRIYRPRENGVLRFHHTQRKTRLLYLNWIGSSIMNLIGLGWNWSGLSTLKVDAYWLENWPKSVSWIWSIIVASRDILQLGLYRNLGPNSSIRIWEDPWFLALPNIRLIPLIQIEDLYTFLETWCF